MHTHDDRRFDTESIDDLDAAICTLAAKLNTETHRLLVLVRAFDDRMGWAKWSFRHCAEWLAWRCGISLSAAREKVRTAQALRNLPAIGAAFADGRLSYSKVRALTRVVEWHDEDSLLEYALRATAAQVEERCRQIRNSRPESASIAQRAWERRALTLWRDAARGVMRVSVEVPIEEGELIAQALDRAVAGGEAAEGIEFDANAWRAQQADALVVTVTESETGAPLDVGRKQRTVPTQLKRALWARDRGCSFPGCDHKHYVDAHHIEHWADGGATSLDNLTLLCSHHHRLLHEGGFAIHRDAHAEIYFRRADGRVIPRFGYRLDDMRDEPSAEVREVGIYSVRRIAPATAVLRAIS